MAQRTTEASVQPGKPVIGPGGFGENVSKDLAELFGLIGSVSSQGIPNGSFELSMNGITPDSWSISLFPGGVVGLDSTTPAHGNRALKITHPGGVGNGGAAVASDYFPIASIQQTSLGFIHWCSSATMKNMVHLSFYTKDKVFISNLTVYDSQDNPPAAVFIICLFEAANIPSNAAFAKVVLTGGDSSINVSGFAYFDGIVFQPVQSSLLLGSEGIPAGFNLPEYVTDSWTYVDAGSVRIIASPAFPILKDVAINLVFNAEGWSYLDAGLQRFRIGSFYSNAVAVPVGAYVTTGPFTLALPANTQYPWLIYQQLQAANLSGRTVSGRKNVFAARATAVW